MIKNSQFFKLINTLIDRLGSPKAPTISDLSCELGMSVPTLREQLEVARALGIIETQPRKGMRLLPYSFTPAVVKSITFAIIQDLNHFQHYSDLRTQIEITYWMRSVQLLEKDDIEELINIVASAFKKLNSNPVQIPHLEHKNLHMNMYKRLGNPFVTGLLEAYWEIYEAIGLDVYTDLDYLSLVWSYHHKMVTAIESQNYVMGQIALGEHMDLLFERSKSKSFLLFE